MTYAEAVQSFLVAFVVTLCAHFFLNMYHSFNHLAFNLFINFGFALFGRYLAKKHLK